MISSKKWKHIWGAIKCAWIRLVVAFLLSLTAALLSIFVFSLKESPYFECSNLVLSIFVGIIASIVASIVYSVSDRYFDSCTSYLWIIDQIKTIKLFLDKPNPNELFNRESWFELWRYYIAICEESRNLTYQNDFKKLNSSICDIFKAINMKNEDLLLKAIQNFNKVWDEHTKPQAEKAENKTDTK